MKKIVVFCPYFGNLHPMFPLWLNSCGCNPDIDFILFTDRKTGAVLPENVRIIYITFKKFREYIGYRFDFTVCLPTPYKLCDYKPSYGYVLEEYARGYDYWGYCDMDMIFGQILQFVPQGGLGKFEKISYLGHLCLYKNEEEINKSFMKTERGTLSYRDIFQSKVSFAFDETGTYGINQIFERRGYRIYRYERHIADIDCYSPNMNISVHDGETYSVKKKKQVFSFEKGHIYGWAAEKNRVRKTEYAYFHAQKRPYHVPFHTVPEKYLLLPDGAVRYRVPSKQFIESCQKNMDIMRYIKIKRKAAENRLILEMEKKKILGKVIR